jgi:adhesin transport system outer membrane protein
MTAINSTPSFDRQMTCLSLPSISAVGQRRRLSAPAGTRPVILAAIALAAAALTPTDGVAQAADPLRATLSELITSAPRVAAARNDAAGAESRINEAWRKAWTPNIDFTHDVGRQAYESQADLDPPTLDASKTVVRATQLLTDFGRSDNQIEEARAVARQSATVATATSEGILLEALTAHWSVVRGERALQYARQSEQSVRTQAELENSMVDLGRGYESNVLQAKVQLATAEARRVRAEGALDIARGRVQAVFGPLSPRVAFNTVMLPAQQVIPKSVEEAREAALKHNKQLQIGRHRSEAIQKRLALTEAKEFRPRLQLMAEQSRRRNTDSAFAGPYYDDTKLMLQFQYSINSGMGGQAAAEAVRRDLEASAQREAETRQLVMEQVHIAWRNLLVARINRETLANQVRIAAKFFQMASEERQMGRRSLLEVLTAEVALINAVSDLVTTEADAAIAGLTLIQATGRLEIAALESQPVEKALPQVLDK